MNGRIHCPECESGGPGMHEVTKDIKQSFESEFDKELNSTIEATVVFQFCPWCGYQYVYLKSEDA